MTTSISLQAFRRFNGKDYSIKKENPCQHIFSKNKKEFLGLYIQNHIAVNTANLL